jgi:hypothetical protein
VTGQLTDWGQFILPPIENFSSAPSHLLSQLLCLSIVGLIEGPPSILWFNDESSISQPWVELKNLSQSFFPQSKPAVWPIET